ncbi:MAG TPA: hypothetical protein VN690_11380 [Terriglobales bacterium]|nr:hypothetical protein [Terriglobales bacterium]
MLLKRNLPVSRYAAVLVAAAVALFSSAQTQVARTAIAVVDSGGAAIGGAVVLFHEDPSGQLTPKLRPDVLLRTNREGAVESELQPGFYDLIVMATAFSPHCQKIFIEKMKPIRITIRLVADPLVAKHLGDAFR